MAANWARGRRNVRIGLSVPLVLALCWGGVKTWIVVQTRQTLRAGQTAFAVGHYATALEAARRVLRSRPEDPLGSLLAARCLTKLGRDGEASLYFRQAGRHALVDQRQRADALVERGRMDLAISVLEDILRIDPRDPEALRQLAAIHHARGEYTAAERLAQRLVQDPASEIVGQSLLGTLHHDLATRRVETPGAAITAFERVLELDPELVRTPIQPRRVFWEFLARDLIADGRTADARRYLERALSRERDPGLLELLGQTHWVEGRLDRADACWQEAAQLDPLRSDPWIDLGQIALRQDRCEDAIKYLDRALELSPGSVTPLYKLIQAHRRLGHQRQADDLQAKLDAIRSSTPPQRPSTR